MEQVRRIERSGDEVGRRDHIPPLPPHGSARADAFDGLNNILKLAAAPKGRPSEFGHAHGQDQGGGRSLPNGLNLMRALDLVHRASEDFKQSEERVRENEERFQETEARAQALTERAIKEVKAMEARLRASETGLWEAEARAEAAEGKAREAQARAEAAERRSRDAEEWLERFHNAIVARFSPRRK